MSAAEPEIGNEVWEAGEEAPRLEEALVVSLDGFAGPLDVLLALARTQKVDLAKISVLALAEQYLGFIAHARKFRLELAADYLVMAAWLAYLKSKLLLPREPSTADQPSGEELAARLAFRLKRLEAMRNAAGHPDDAAPARPRRVRPRHAGRRAHHPCAPVHCRGVRPAQGLRRAALAHGQTGARGAAPHRLVHQGCPRPMQRLVGRGAAQWVQLDLYLEQYLPGPELARTALASSFGATLEMARDGLVELSQAEPFAPIYMRRREEGAEWQRVS